MPVNPLMAVGAGVCSAVAVFSIVAGTVLTLPLFYLASLPLYLAGLGLGSKGALIALGAAVVTAGLLGGIYAAFPFAIAYGVPVIVTCRQALATAPGAGGKPIWGSVGGIVGSLTAIGAAALMFVAMTALIDENIGPLPDAVAGFLGDALDAMSAEMPGDAKTMLVSGLAPFFPGMAVASWVVMHIVNAALGQRVLVRSGRNLRPRVAYANITLPDWCSWVLVVAGVMALALPGDWSYIGRNLVIVALVPFFILGLAVAHTFARQFANGGIILVIFYMLLIVLGWFAFAVAAAGVIEQWVGLRKRMRPAGNQENE